MTKRFDATKYVFPNIIWRSRQILLAFLENMNSFYVQELHFKMEVDGKIRISTDDMDLCGDIVQALAEYLGVDDLASSCDFPPEIGKIEQLLVKADELQSVRQRLSSEMADQSGLIRTLIVRTEDSRIMMDM